MSSTPALPSAPLNPEPHAAVQALEAELRRSALRKWRQRAIVVLLIVAAVFGFRAWRKANAPAPEPRFKTKTLEVRDIVEIVESTGRLKPLTEVQVGAQVSGRVTRVFVDFNDRVKKGDLLAEIDPQIFGAQVGQVTGQLEAAKAALGSAKARAKAADVQLDRMKRLAKENLASTSELDQATSTRDVAASDVNAAQASIVGLQAQLRSVQTTLTYTKIYSPIDGVVINRAVQPGQTMAASFNAPVLFVIAQDLSRMQVLADIDEADVGKIKEGMSAKVTVDAFAGETFAGKVVQIRYNPNEVQGVVTYSAVIDVNNPEAKLRPGMTATVTITTREVRQTTAVPNAALRFRPQDKDRGNDLASLQHGESRLYHVKSGGSVGKEELEPLVAKTGLSDGVWTELPAPQTVELKPGLAVVTEQTEKPEARRMFGLF